MILPEAVRKAEDALAVRPAPHRAAVRSAPTPRHSWHQRQRRHPNLVLRPERDEVAHGRLVAALDVGSQKLATLREADAVEASLQPYVVLKLLAHHVDLRVTIAIIAIDNDNSIIIIVGARPNAMRRRR